MSTWAKIKFYYDSIPEKAGVVASATSTDTASDYNIDYLASTLEGSFWKAVDASNVDLEWDAGAGNGFDADYVAIMGHNLSTTNALIVLQSSDNAASWTDAFTPYTPVDDRVELKEFSPPGAKRYWRLHITALSSTPFIAIVKVGLKTELDYATAGLDPHAEQKNANVNISYGGFVTGIHERFSERQMSIRFSDADSVLYAKVKNWWETNGIKPFFVAWELANNPSEVFLMRADSAFNNPLTNGGAYRDITINLKGRKE